MACAVVRSGLTGRCGHSAEVDAAALRQLACDPHAPPATAGHFTVNVNQASINELAQLPELGMATAQRIIDHRREHGPFASLDALLDVPGIGPATLEAMRPHLRPIRPRTTSP